MLRLLAAILAAASLGAALYLAWALHRVSPEVLMTDRDWPRIFPYPDTWLMALENHFDAQHPAPPGTIKLSGELARVRFTLWTLAVGAALLFAVASLVCAMPVIRRHRHRRRRGFDPFLPHERGNLPTPSASNPSNLTD